MKLKQDNYTQQQFDSILMQEYPLCKTLNQKQALATKLGFDSIYKLDDSYNRSKWVDETIQAAKASVALEIKKKQQRDQLRKKDTKHPLRKKR